MELVLIIGGAVIVMLLLNKWQGLSLSGESSKLIRQKERSFPFCAVVDGPGLFEFDIVGESHYQEALNEISGGKIKGGHSKEVIALLFPENDNPHDNQAVCVQVQKRTVGYLSRQHARELRAQAKQPGIYWKVPAKIVGGWDDGRGSVGHYGVKLDLPVE